MTNLADKNQVQAAEKAERRRAERKAKDFRAIMETEPGRRFVADMLDFCGFQRSSFTGNSTTYFNEGKREVALSLWRRINENCSDLYFTMIADAQKAQENDQ